ncbi:MAG: nickel-dependent hydrogenase large subunit [Micrococcales bacterium]|nr:nickel-dependent hydrogenase large subunit [Micrococcales bacterium]MCL2667008.1 nickel-dependent hydrogenase large subunit [Micrococcales bacterium]
MVHGVGSAIGDPVSQRWVLDEIVDAYGATVVVERDAQGRASAARFDLTGLPRVDAMLTGQPVGGVPALVERLCGICPAAHHLAGVRALEALATTTPTPAGTAVRALLHHGATIETHAARLAVVDPQGAMTLRTFGKAAAAAAGSPGHFPATAVVGGVAGLVPSSACDELAASAGPALEAAVAIAGQELSTGAAGHPYRGADVALVGSDGHPDLLGERLRVVAADGTVVEPSAAPAGWDDLVVESVPGAPAPRPYLVALGPSDGGYRVGPVSQLRVGTLTTPVAAGLQAQWAAAGAGARVARAIITVHCVEAVAAAVSGGTLTEGDPQAAPGGFDQPGVGVGWADGPRGLLVHRYVTDGSGTLTQAMILTPTAQNERWLAELLLDAVDHPGAAGADGVVAGQPALEEAVREADPCLPVTSAPIGGMGLTVATVAASEPRRGSS